MQAEQTSEKPEEAQGEPSETEDEQNQ